MKENPNYPELNNNHVLKMRYIHVQTSVKFYVYNVFLI